MKLVLLRKIFEINTKSLTHLKNAETKMFLDEENEPLCKEEINIELDLQESIKL